MARESPYFQFVSDTSDDEDPTEYECESNGSSPPEVPPAYPRVTSDDRGYVAPHIPIPETTPATVPTGTARQPTDPTTGRPVRMTPRMRTVSCVRTFPVGFSEPRGKAPMIEREMPRDEPPPKRSRPAHLEYMPTTLQQWRRHEGIPSTLEVGATSRALSYIPLTGEPLELTVPTLVAVTRSLVGMQNSMRREIHELLSDASRLDGDMMEVDQRLDSLDCHRDVDRAVVEVTRARMADLEREARIARIVTGACVLLSVLATAMGMFLPRFY